MTLNSYKKLFTHNQKNIESQIDSKTKQIKNAMEELEKVNLQLYDIAHTDHLTKTMNRRNFFIHAQNIFSVSKKENIEFTTVMIDIDNFKSYNDKYGHDVGDRVLIEFTKTIQNQLESNDIFGRLGGEEFALVFPKTSLKNAIKKVEDIKDEIEQIDIFVYEEVINITASFGVSDNYGSNNIDEMLQKSDKLLYNAKKDGKNLVRSRLHLS
ncbi:GGDEF domain-containing protein [Poseidonibacter lekithochrous]|uniref:GGDEF domain-containing protein n=1 Tax=Poseidonibacter lekithochrous TaxID=1904463 RepID=UPI000D331D05|nr:GGDEF domain-containing protein [Poseidonibacter lekithochrous]